MIQKFINLALCVGSEVDTKRFDFSGKMGYVNPQIPYQSLGFQFAYSDHNQNSYLVTGYII